MRWGGIVALALLAGCPEDSAADEETDDAGTSTSPGSTSNETTTGPGSTSDAGSATGTDTVDPSGVDLVFDVGVPDVAIEDMPPPEYGTTPLEQVWYLTQGTNNDILIDFRFDPPMVTCETGVGSSPGSEGTAVFTLPDTGDLLFYTDGNTVLSGQTHNVVANGTALTGNSSCTEAALITPYPGLDNVFYILTNGTNAVTSSTISYSVIDLSMGPDGTITDKNQVLMSGNPGEALDVVPHTNGADFWILTYDTSATLNAYLVDAAGVNLTPVQSPTGIVGSVLRSGINHSETFDRIVFSGHQGADCGFVATADINRTTGAITGVEVHVDECTGIGFQASFSPDATKVYYAVGTEGYLGTAHQFDLATDTPTMLDPTVQFGASKLAPDGRVYFARYNQPYLGVVTDPNAAGLGAGFVADGLHLAGCNSGWSVPNQTSAFLDYLDPEG